MVSCQQSSPLLSGNAPNMLSPGTYQVQHSSPVKSTYPVPLTTNQSPTPVGALVQQCPVINEPLGSQRPSPAVRTPTTPQNPGCSFAFAEELSRNTFATPSPPACRRSSTTAAQGQNSDPNSLRMLQQLTRGIPAESYTEDARKLSSGKSTFSPTCDTKRPRYNSASYVDRSSNVQQPHFQNKLSPYQTSTPPARSLPMNEMQNQASQQPTGISLNPMSNKDMHSKTYVPPAEGLPAPPPRNWPTIPPTFSRQQSAPPYSHFMSRVPDQAHSSFHQQFSYAGAAGSNDRHSNSFNAPNCSFPPDLSAAYQQQHFMAGPSGYMSPDLYARTGNFQMHNPLPQEDNAMVRTSQAFGAYSQQPGNYNPYDMYTYR